MIELKMNTKNLLIFIGYLLLQTGCTNAIDLDKKLNPSLALWYDKPANSWTEALPVGNGRLGAMVYGGMENETIQFNEETLWTGQPHDYANDGASEVFKELRELLWSGKQEEAHKLGNEQFMSDPMRQQCYQPFGNILLNFPGHKNAINFKRKLDLEEAISSVTYEVDGVGFKREVFASEPDQTIIIRLESSKNGQLNFIAGLDSPHEKYDVSVDGNVIIIKGKANDYPEKARKGVTYPESKLTFEARLEIINEGGEIVRSENTIKVVDAKSATLKLVAATSFVNYKDISGDPSQLCKNYLEDSDGKSYSDLMARHINDYDHLFKRVELDLGESEISNRPTNERLATFKQDEDPSMVALLYQYGRYLLISSSRKGTQPANLQGIWNDKLTPKWDSKYTININTEMNYWLAEMCNLSELVDPLIVMVEDLSETGKNVAKKHYDIGGWVTHHNTDIWRAAAPINNANHGVWPVGGAWLTQHLWWHYQFSGDKEYLKNRAYPIMKEASMFFTEYLVSDPKNPDWLVSGPSHSPENGGMVMAPTMDHQIIRNLFANTIEAATVLGVDADFVCSLQDKRSKIAPNQIGKYGQLQEWLEDKDDPKSHHRHVSHLWGLHPGNEISPRTTPELAEACKVTLSQRGDGGTGWSRAWKINFWARLLDGDHSFLLLKNLMMPSESEETNYEDRGGLYNNLFDAHPPFQIDGNFGATSGITEMLLQSHLRDENGDYYMDILPALPVALSSGKISGIKGSGGFEISIDWENGKLVQVIVQSLLGNNLNLRYNGKLINQTTGSGETYAFQSEDF
jgi:alpha-L-fucosidase 2